MLVPSPKKNIIMKKVICLQVFFFFFFMNFSQGQTIYFSENFEKGIKPDGWKDEYVTYSIPWEYHEGGYGINNCFDCLATFPDTAYSGKYNAVLQQNDNTKSVRTRLVTPPINLEFAIKPELKFGHAQVEWAMDQDKLRLYYKSHLDSTWKMLVEYTSEVPEWTEKALFLPDNELTDSFYLAFEGEAKAGFGVCIDSIIIQETGIIPKHVESILYSQSSTNKVASGSRNNEILSLKIKNYGNTGNVKLDSIGIFSTSTDTLNISPSGVKLFITEKENFNTNTQVGVAKSFSSEKVIFDNLNFTLPDGYSYLWITYDCDLNSKTGNILDGQILEGSIKFIIDTAGMKFNQDIFPGNDTIFYILNGDTLNAPIISTFPSNDVSPPGHRLISQSIFYDQFDPAQPWVLGGEFEINFPMGLGDSLNGNPDPFYALEGTKILGYDLSSDGNYSSNLDTVFMAETPLIDCYYFKDVSLSYYRWLNIENNAYDGANVQISSDSGITWQTIWENPLTVSDDHWKYQSFDIPGLERQEKVKLRFTLGPTDGFTSLSGWNIDKFALTGYYVTRDVGIKEWISPLSGCGHSSQDSVKVVLHNYGAKPFNDTIPLVCYFGGNINQAFVDTFIGEIPVNGDVVITFPGTIDLSNPYFFDASEVYCYTMLQGDEYEKNDTLHMELDIVPTYTPPVKDDFESGFGFWKKKGNANSWEYGKPSGTIINSAASGEYAWVTNLNGNYPDLDSSYLESPCYDFSNTRNPIFEWKYWIDSEDGADGLSLLYSVDDGVSWHIADTHNHSFTWNWFEKDTIASLGNHGWDSISGGWITAKQFLPRETAYQPLVKFRIGFESDSSLTSEGAAFDDIRIYDAPPDLGVDSILTPQSACELSKSEPVKVVVKNHFFDTLLAGDTIHMGIMINEGIPYVDTFVLHSDFLPGDTMHYQFTCGFDLYQSGEYHLKVYPVTNIDNNIYSDFPYNNDTASKSILVRKPYVELGQNIYSVHPDTIFLDASAGSQNTYEWEEVGQVGVLSTDSIYNPPGKGKYAVRVKDNMTGCVAKDTVELVQLVADVGVDSLVSPLSSCELGDSLPVTILVKNFGTDTIRGNYLVNATFKFEGGMPKQDTFLIADTVYPGGTYAYTFDSLVSIIDEKIYGFQIYTGYVDDTIGSNDTNNFLVEVFGYPSFDLFPGDSTLRRTTYLLDASIGNPEIVSFFWEDSSTNATFLVDKQGGDYYSVTGADINGCGVTDSAFIRLVIPDISITRIIQPDSFSCEPYENDIVKINIANTGTDTIFADTLFSVSYNIDGNIPVADTIVLQENMYPGDSIQHVFSSNLNLSSTGTYIFKGITSLSMDSVRNNDTIAFPITIYPLPVVNLGNDTFMVSGEYILDAGEGFEAYQWHDSSFSQTFKINKYSLTSDRIYSVNVVDSNNCKASDDISVTILFWDISVVDINFNDTICVQGKEEYLEVTLLNEGNITITSMDTILLSYSVNGGSVYMDSVYLEESSFLPGGDSIIHVFSSSEDMSKMGDYVFDINTFLEYDDYPENDSMQRSVHVKANPVVDWQVVNDTLVVNELPYSLDGGAGFSSYLWQDSSTNRFFQVESEGLYSVTIMDNYGCLGTGTANVGSLGTTVKLYQDLGVNANIYPNPASSILHVLAKFNSTRERVSLELFNSLGQEKYTCEVKNVSLLNEQLDVSKLSPGIYFLMIQSGDIAISKKIVVK